MTEYALKILSYMAIDETKIYSAEEIFKDKCVFHNRWANVRKEINKVLSTTTLAEMKKEGPYGHVNSNLLLTKIK
jgi:DNA-binding IscR family transcriptional regulator